MKKIHVKFYLLLFCILTNTSFISAQYLSSPVGEASSDYRPTRDPAPTVTTMVRNDAERGGAQLAGGGIPVFTLGFDDLQGEYQIAGFYNDIGVQFDSNWFTHEQEDFGGSGDFCGNPSGTIVASWENSDQAIINFNFGEYGLGFVNRIEFWYASNSRNSNTSNPQQSGFVIYDNLFGLGNPLAVINFPNEIQSGPNGCFYSAWFPSGVNFLNAAYSIRFFGQAEEVYIDDLTFYAQDLVALEVTQNPILLPEGEVTQLSARLIGVPANGTVLVDVDHFSGDNDIYVNAGSPAMVFTETNWDIPQSVNIGASEDSDQSNGSAVLLVARRGGLGNSSSGGTSGTLITPIEVTVNEADDDVTLTMAASPAGLPASATSPPTGSQTNLDLNSDLPFQITADPPAGFLFSGFQASPGGVQISAPIPTGTGGFSTSLTSVPFGVNPTVTAVFVAETEVNLTVSASPSSGGTIKVAANMPVSTGTFPIPLNTDVNLKAIPASGKDFDFWQVTSGDSGAIVDPNNADTTINTGQDTSIVANFTDTPPGVLSWVISPANLVVEEGGVETVQIQLSSPPDANVTFSVIPDATSSSDLDVDGSNTFTIPGGSSDPISVPIRAFEDDFDTENGQAFFDVKKTGGPHPINDSGFNASADDDDIVLNLFPLYPEDGSTSPSSPVVLDSAGSNSDMPYEITATPVDGLIFHGWIVDNNPQNFTLTPPEIDQDGVATSEVSANSDIVMAAEFTSNELQFVATPNPVVVPENGESTVAITLGNPPQPAGDGRTVIAKITASSGDGDLTVDNESQTFTFTDNNWNNPTAWVKTFRAAPDGDDVNGQRTFLVEQVGGTSVDLLPDLVVNAVEQDDDEISRFLVVEPTSLTIEPGQRDEFRVRLSTRPTGPVEVKIEKFSGDPNNYIRALNATGTFAPLVFDESSWNVPQAIVMNVWSGAASLLDPEDTVPSRWRVSQVGGSGADFGHTAVSVNAIGSDGIPNIQLSPGTLSLEVGERRVFGVWLSDPPTSQTLELHVEFEGDFGVLDFPTGPLLFDQSNYETSQAVGFTANDVGSGVFRIQWQSGDPVVETKILEVTVSGGPPRLIATPASLEVSEGQNASFSLSLSDAPDSDVAFSMTASGDGDLSVVSPPSGEIVFTPSDYPNPQVITVAGGSVGAGSIVVSQLSGTPSIDSLSVPVTVNQAMPAFVLNPAALQMNVGSEAEFTVRLATRPDGPVTADLTASGTAQLTIIEPIAPLNFTPTDFQTPQVVRISAGQAGSGNLSVTQTGGAPTIPQANLPVTVAQGSDISVLANPSSLEFDSNQSRAFQVSLSGPPQSDVTLALTASDASGNPGVQVTSPGNGRLVFTPGNFSQTQTVNVTASSTGTGQVNIAHLAGPEVNGLVVPVVVDSADCTGTLTVTPFSTTLAEGSPGSIQVTQTNLYGLTREFQITSVFPGAVSFSVPERVSIENGQTLTVPIAALEDDNLDDELVRFVISEVQPNSPPCSFPNRNFDLASIDDDYHLTLTTSGDDGSSVTVPPAGVATTVDTTTFSSGNYFVIGAQGAPGYQFSHWTGDVFLLGGSSNPSEDPTPFIMVDGPDPAIQQVNLTAHFIPGDIEVDEEIDAITDALLDELIAQCGLGAADFNEFNMESGNRTGAMEGGRILPHSGQEMRDETDLVLPGLDHPTQLRMTRRHLTRRNADRSPFGPAWFFNYRIYFTRDEFGNILLHNLGRTDLFSQDPVVSDVWHGTGGRFGRMVRETANRVTLRAPSGVKWQFLSIWDSSNILFKGVLQKIISPNGNEIQFNYQLDGGPLLDQKMIQIVDAYGREVDLIYGSDGMSPYVTEIRDHTDPNAVRVWLYSYDSEGFLTSVRSPTVTSTGGFNDFPQGKLTEYTYRRHSDLRLKYALKSILAPNQTHANQTYSRYEWTYYDEDPQDRLFGFVKSHTVGNPTAPFPLRSGGTFEYSYQPMAHGGGIDEVAMCTTVVDRQGVYTTLDYNRRGLLLEERVGDSGGGPVIGSANQFRRAFTYNQWGDMTSFKTPIQVEQEEPSSYQEEHPDPQTTPRHMLRQERRKIKTADHRGGDQSEILSEIRYEPIFNKVFSTVDPRGLGSAPEYAPSQVTTYQYYDYMEDLTAAIDYFAPQLGLTVSELTFQMNQAGIVDRIRNQWGINPLNGVKIDINEDGRTDLDPCGNLIRRDFPNATLPPESSQLGLNPNQVAYERFIYNRYGQLVQQVDGEQNVTTLFYYSSADPNGWNGTAPSAAYAGGGGFLARKIENDAVADPSANSGSGAPEIHRVSHFSYVANGNFPRNARGVATMVTDGRGVVSRNLVNELDQTIIHHAAWQVPSGDPNLAILRYKQRYSYDANNNLRETSVQNKGGLSGGATYYFDTTVFDILDQPIRKTRDSRNDGLALTTEYEYDANQNLIRKTEGLGTAEEAVTSWQHDQRDLLRSVTRGATGDAAIGEVATTAYEYDDNGNRVREIDNDGDITHYFYDGMNRLFRTVDRVGNVREHRFNAASQVISSEAFGPAEEGGPSILLSKEESRYDQRGRSFETLAHLFHYPARSFGSIDPGDNGTMVTADYGLVRSEVIYDRLGRSVGRIDAEGDLHRIEYNGLGGIYRNIDPLGNIQLNEYDSNHNLVQVTERHVDPEGNLDDELFVAHYRYDALNRRFSVEEPNGQVTLNWHDSRNNLVRVRDHLSNDVEFHFDALNRKVEEIRYLSEKGTGAGANSHTDTIHLKTEWDSLDRLTARIDDQGNRTEYGYDDLSRLISRIQPGGHTERWVFNGDGEIVRQENQAGSVANWKYDPAGRAVEMTIDHGTMHGDFSFSGTVLKRWEYDGLNRKTLTFDDNGSSLGALPNRQVGCVYVYDSLSRPLLEIQTLGTVEAEKPFALGKGVQQEWEGHARLVSQVYPNGRRIDRTYDALDRLAEVREAAGGLIATFDYMGPNRDLRIGLGNGTVLDKRDPDSNTTLGYGYDTNGRSLNHRWSLKADGTLVAGYSDLYNGFVGRGTNRVTSQYRDHLSRGDQWQFDSRYRIKGFQRNGDTNLASYRVLDGADAMTEFLDEGFHQTPIPDWRWIDYLYFGGLPRPHDENGNLRYDTQVDFEYDFFNRLVAVRDFNSGQLLAEYVYSSDNRRVLKIVGTERTRYLYQGWQVLEERDAGDQPLRQFVEGRSLDEHLQLLDMTGTNTAYYYHTNAQGFVGALSNEQGQVVEYAEYSMLGRPTLLEGVSLEEIPEAISSVGNPYLFQGRRYDPETRFYYYRNRYYDPLSGNFITLDPMGRWQHGQGNGFSAFSGDPWNRTDPMGLDDNLNPLTLLLAGLQGIMETQERFYNWIGLGLQEETIDPSTVGFTQQQASQLERIQAENEQAMAGRNLLEMIGLLSGSTGGSGGTTLAAARNLLARCLQRNPSDGIYHVLRRSTNGRNLVLGDFNDVYPYKYDMNYFVINIGEKTHGISPAVYGPWSPDLNQALVLEEIISGSGVVMVTRHSPESFWRFGSQYGPYSIYYSEVEMLRTLGLLGGAL